MIFSIEKRRFRRDGKVEETRSYYLRYRIGDMPVDKWVSLGVTDFQVADKKAHAFIQEREREAAGIIEPKLVRDAAQRPLREHLDDYEADLLTRGRAGRGGRGARSLKAGSPAHGGLRLEVGGQCHSGFIHHLAQRAKGGGADAEPLFAGYDFVPQLDGAGGADQSNPLKFVGKVDERGKKKVRGRSRMRNCASWSRGRGRAG